jgi:anti-anti-sigma regulatory factor
VVELRTFRLWDGTSVVALRGELDNDAAARARDEVARCLRDGVVVVDLLNVWLGDNTALDVLVPALLGGGVTVVSEHAFPRGVRRTPTLASALAT